MVLETWTDSIMPVITNSDFGFLGNLIPLFLVLGVSWALCKKPRELLFVQFPICLGIKLIFPFFHISFLAISFAAFVMNIIGSKGDLLADIKEMPQKVRDRIQHVPDLSRKGMERLKKLREEDIIKNFLEKNR